MDGDTQTTQTTEGGMPPTDVGLGGTSQGIQAPPSLFSSLTDEGLRGHQGLAKFRDADVNTFAKSYIELDKLRNDRSGVKPLTAESTPDEITAYRAAMGIPEAPEKYELGELSFPEAATPSQEQMRDWMQTFHEAHLSQEQVQKIMGRYASQMSSQWNAISEQQQAQSRETMKVLTQKYGAEAPALAQLAHEYVKRRFGDEGLQSLDFQPGNPRSVGNSPVLFEILLESAKLTGHDKFIAADGRGGMMDAGSARAKYSELSQKFFATQDEGERAALQEEMRRLAPRGFSD